MIHPQRDREPQLDQASEPLLAREQKTQGAKYCAGGGGAGAASAILTRQLACDHPNEPRQAHPCKNGSVTSPRSRQNRQHASSGAPPLNCETRASARDCTSMFVLRRARTNPLHFFLCPPEAQCVAWHSDEQ